MLRYLALGLAFVLILSVAVYDGVINHRWTRNTEAEDFATIIEGNLPDKIGDWTSIKYEVDDEILRVAGAVGYISRSYTNQATEQSVKVWLIVGPFKHVIRHTPDICYPAQDFRMQGRPSTYSFDIGNGGNPQFLTSTFEKRGFVRQRVFWSWLRLTETGEGEWFASPSSRENRGRYAGTPALFKLYFTTIQPQEDSPAEVSPANDFAKEFLPALNSLIKSGVAHEPSGEPAES